jgi:hypothetical protein
MLRWWWWAKPMTKPRIEPSFDPRPKEPRVVPVFKGGPIWDACRARSPFGPVSEWNRAVILREFGPEAAQTIDFYNAIMFGLRID